MKPVMSIGQAAREAGVGVETIRFYERQGLVEQPPKPEGVGTRLYPTDLVERIRFIREAQQLGFSLREAGELLMLRADPNADCSDVREQAAAKLREVEQKIEQLRQLHVALETLIASCPGHGALPACSIMDALTWHRLPRQAPPLNPPRSAARLTPSTPRKGHHQ